MNMKDCKQDTQCPVSADLRADRELIARHTCIEAEEVAFHGSAVEAHQVTAPSAIIHLSFKLIHLFCIQICAKGKTGG